MSPTPEQRDKLACEMRQSSTPLNLQDDQRQNLEELLLDAYKKMLKDRRQNPTASNED
jgi:hypothetical protein